MTTDLPSTTPIVGTSVALAGALGFASSDDFTVFGVEKLRGSGPRTLAADMQTPQ